MIVETRKWVSCCKDDDRQVVLHEPGNYDYSVTWCPCGKVYVDDRNLLEGPREVYNFAREGVT